MRTTAIQTFLGLFLTAVGVSSFGEVLWPGGAGVKAKAGNCATIEEKDGPLFVHVGDCRPHLWPGVYFAFDGRRDFSKCASVKVTITNCTDRSLRFGVKVKGETVQGRLPDSGLTIPPHAAYTKDLRLYAEAWAFDKPHGLVGLKRMPHVGGGSSYALEKVTSIAVYLPAGTSQTTFGVSRVETTPGDVIGNNLKVLKADSFFPWVDEFGQANYAEFPDKVHSKEELAARTATEARELMAKPVGIPDADRFGGWVAGPQLKATGFFRVEKVNGKWWFVDPDGRLFLSQGVNMGWNYTHTAVTFREKYFEKLPPRDGATKQFWLHHTKTAYRNFYSDPAHVPYDSFSFSMHNLFLKYGTDWRAKDAEMVVRRTRAWGINTTTGTSGAILKQPERVPYVTGIGPKSRPIVGVKGYWGLLLDPFAPEFAESCRRQAEAARAKGTNEWCIGWTANNELSWTSDGAALARGVLASPDDQPAKIALLRLLAARGKTVETATLADLRALGEAVADKYYSTVRAAIKAVAPNHLYMGDRNDKQNPEVYRAASRHCDVLTVNIDDYRPTRELPKGAVDRPFLVTEFHFGCYDTGYFYASLIPVKDQKTRAACYLEYLRAVIDNPNYIGAHWFQWRDCPITGVVGESANAQCGLVSMTDVPYTELIGAIKTISAEMYPRRAK